MWASAAGLHSITLSYIHGLLFSILFDPLGAGFILAILMIIDRFHSLLLVLSTFHLYVGGHLLQLPHNCLPSCGVLLWFAIFAAIATPGQCPLALFYMRRVLLTLHSAMSNLAQFKIALCSLTLGAMLLLIQRSFQLCGPPQHLYPDTHIQEPAILLLYHPIISIGLKIVPATPPSGIML